MRSVHKKEFNAAIAHFRESDSFFSRYSWVDKYRALTILSLSNLSYREMALCNIAFCYSHTNEPKKAKELYEKILLEYPNNGIAYYSLNAINTFSEGQ
ncbi:tetratricopeptide repeat protein [Sphingobacterium deserti]|nr:tetratricopeptide repeat protein [Sphingobacterium deserti]